MEPPHTWLSAQKNHSFSVFSLLFCEKLFGFSSLIPRRKKKSSKHTCPLQGGWSGRRLGWTVPSFDATHCFEADSYWFFSATNSAFTPFVHSMVQKATPRHLPPPISFISFCRSAGQPEPFPESQKWPQQNVVSRWSKQTKLTRSR